MDHAVSRKICLHRKNFHFGRPVDGVHGLRAEAGGSGAAGIWPGEIIHPPLTTVRDPFERMGAAAADLLIDAIEQQTTAPNSATFVPEMVVHDSTLRWQPWE